MRKLLKISLVLISLTSQIAPAFANPPSAEQLAEWRAAAEQRNQARTQVLRQVQGTNNWHVAETIMNRDTTVRYLESISRLERRYPGAVPQAEQNYRDAFMQLHLLEVDGKGTSADLKKDAAFRYFDQPKVQDSIGSGLDNRQVLSLAWAAAQDKSIFSTRLEREDRKWGLLESLANIQRAHNDCLAGGAIEWRQTHQADRPSCEVGKFKRLLEHLDQLHPDVQLSPPLREDRAPSPQIMTDAILEGHRALAHTISASERHRIASDPAAAQTYRERLITRVHEIHPAIQAATLEAHLGPDWIEMLFDADEWTVGAAGACHPAAAHGITQVREEHPRFNGLSPAFRDLGGMHEVAGLIWSGVAPQIMNQRAAVDYCNGLGSGARLPTQDEYISLSRAMGSRQPVRYDGHGDWRADYNVAGYNLNLIPDMHNREFWSASVHPRSVVDAFLFNGDGGFVDDYIHYDNGVSVRCVVGG